MAVFLPNGRPLGEVSELPPWLRPSSAPVSERSIAGEEVRIVTLPIVVPELLSAAER